MQRTIRIATRESPLALWQANHVAASLRKLAPEFPVELVPVSTIGDRDRVEPLHQFGGQGAFTREVQHAVLKGHADLAVHSLKDLPTVPHADLILAGVPARAPRFDALILPEGTTGDLLSLPPGAKVGTGSLRRKSQLLRQRPDLQLAEIRGNVDTRLSKVDTGEYAAIILAEAGLHRLGLQHRITQTLSPPVMYPAVGQAALGIECRRDDAEVQSLLNRLSDELTMAEVLAERACLRTLQAGCHAPVGILSSIVGDSLTLTSVILSVDGQQLIQATITGPRSDPETVGDRLAEDLLRMGAAPLLI
ncbi:hydroxymethylbilane synthase [Planctomicrobium sp. SH664]|uniref:hydroxymethylbilane synthase n=1 Tax=Planctomicrobium sp. SH664 TaxID=3448125 RepID=UPI003F5B4CC5